MKQQTVTASGAHATFRRITVGVQIGLSVILLIGAGLFIRTLRNLQTVDVGFATDHLVTFIIDPRLAGFDSKEVTPLYRRMLEILSALPGVHSVAITDNPDLADNNDTYNLIVPGISSEGEQNLQRNEWERVNPRYLETLKLPLVAGRFVGDQDQLGSLRAAAINELLAKKAFGSTANAIGRTFRVGRGGVELTVVGVVGDTKHQGVRQEAEPIFYTSIFQEQEPKSVEFYVRTYQEPEAAMNMVRQSVRELDSRLVLNQLQTMDDQIGGILINERLLAMLATGFGAVAVLMAGVGLYGVLAFSTSQRTREIGVRMALGASRVQVVKLVIREVLLLGGISIAIAIPIAMALAQVLRGQLYGVSARDPLTMFLVVLCAAVLSCLAAFIPARRASSIDPMSALRYE